MADAAGRHFHSELLALLDRVLPLREPVLLGEDGKPAWSLETRDVEFEGRTLIYAVNLSPEPLRLTLRTGGRSVTWLEGGPLEGPPFTLPPQHPILLEL